MENKDMTFTISCNVCGSADVLCNISKFSQDILSLENNIEFVGDHEIVIIECKRCGNYIKELI